MHRNTLKVCVGLCLLLISVYATNIRPPTSEVLASEPFPPNRPVVFTDPDFIERDVGVEFTVSAKIFNLTNNVWTDPDTMKQYPLGNLYGVGITFNWDPAVLEHVNHLVKIPVDDYPDGVLYAPTTMWKDEVNDAAGTCRVEYSSMAPAAVFNNPDQNNTVFEITLKAKKRGSSLLRLTQVSLAGQLPGDRIYHEGYAIGEGAWGRGAIFTTPGAPVAEFSVWPADLFAGVNKPVMFNASKSYDTDGTITTYMWTFGDGSTGSTADPIIYHTYTSKGSPKATLRVRDNDGLESLLYEKPLTVVEKRDVTVRDIDVQLLIRYGSTAEINVTVSTPRDVHESFTVSTFYNSTDTDGWVLIGAQSVADLAGDSVVVFSWNTGDIVLPPGIKSRSYHILTNATYVPHEANTTDNSMTSPLVEVTSEEIHDVSAAISGVNVEAAGGRSFGSPFIRGENVTVRFTVKSSGTVDETCDITLRFIARNDTELLPPREWIGEFLEYANERPYRFSTVDLPAAFCNITLNVDVTGVDRHPEDNYGSIEVRVVKPPTIQIQYPENIHKSESVTFDATASLHQDPDGQITTYTWDVMEPGGTTYGSVKGGNKVGYTFNLTGSTRVRLRIMDNFGLSYDASIRDVRPAIDAYMRELTIDVQESSGGGLQLPIDPLYIVIGIVIVVIVAVVAFRIIRKPKPSA